MAHEFVLGGFRKDAAWHGLGEVFTDNPSLLELVQRTGGDYDVEVLPIGVTLPNGEFFEDTGRYAIMRPPVAGLDSWERLRVVGNRYQPIQNWELAMMLEPLQSHMPVEAFAVLKNGKITYFLLKMEPFDVGGNANEQHYQYLLVSDDKGGGSAVWGLTNVRVVCANTYRAAMAGDGILTIPHYTDTEMEISFRVNLLRYAQEARQAHIAQLNQLFTHKVNSVAVDTFFKTVFPIPKETRSMKLAKLVPDDTDSRFTDVLERGDAAYENYARQVERAMKLRENGKETLARFNDETPYCANTTYALFQTVTNMTSHSDIFTGDPDKKHIARLFGQLDGYNSVAYKAALEMVK